jgi:small subunit ribosomal protein S21|tara:strand:- start:1324 stop:1626 length:303 start_codon:yes stop_codon:yes gene_type:complete
MGYNKYRNSNTKTDSRKPYSRKPRDKNAPVKVSGLKVWVQHGEVDRALRKFKKKVNNDGKFRILKEREYFEKPSERKRKQKARAVKRWQKQAAINRRPQV